MTIVAEDLCTWEAEYADGTVHRESDGTVYAALDRNSLAKFSIIAPDGVVLFETWPPLGRDGHHLVYRRRITLSDRGRSAGFVVGWLNGGPAFYIDVTGGTYRCNEEGFVVGDSQLYPPVPMRGELYFEDIEGK